MISITAWIIGSLVGGSFAGWFTYSWGYRTGKKYKVRARGDATIETLDEALRLDQALERCQYPTAWVRHDHDESPHCGVWLYIDDEGCCHISSRYRTRDRGAAGENAAEAIRAFRDFLLDEARDKERRLKEVIK